MFLVYKAFVLFSLPLCSLLVYNGYTNANIDPCLVGT